MRWRFGFRHLIAAAGRDRGTGASAGDPARAHLAIAMEALAATDPDGTGDLLVRLRAGRRLSGRQRKKLARMLFDRGFVRAAQAAADGRMGRFLRYGTVDTIRRAYLMLTAPPTIPARRPGGAGAPAIDVAYLAASALPDQVTGYTSRTQALAEAMIGEGFSLACLVRTGYPTDRRRDVRVWSPVTERRIGQVRYLYDAEREHAPYLARSADALLSPTVARLERRLAAVGPRLVHAASNHVNALPGLIAARRRGLPFVYEVRGLWEMSAASTRPGWTATERFALEAGLETRVAREADLVLTLTGGLRRELEGRGVPAAAIRVLPNAVDTGRFAPVPRDEALAARHGLAGARLAIVYAGSLVRYEGLDDLVLAVARVRGTGLDCRLLFVGDGPVRVTLRELAVEAGIGDAVRFVDPVPQSELPAMLALADVCAFPRKDLEVCRIVSPLKPFEAMAAGVPVIVSRVEALCEIVGDGTRGLICEPDDPESLARTLLGLANDPGSGQRVAAAALDWVRRERSWAVQAKLLRQHYADAGLWPADAAPARGPA